ncbi:MAG: hypothetical protein ACXVBE_00085 [Bdellovibrionota bacterium]
MISINYTYVSKSAILGSTQSLNGFHCEDCTKDCERLPNEINDQTPES